MYEMTTEIPFTKTGADNRLKLHEAVGMMMDCCQFQEYQEKAFCEYVKWNPLFAKPYVVDADPWLVERIGRDDMVRGYTISAVGFYGPQGREVRARLAEPELNRRIEAFEYAGGHITNYEMESAALQGLAKILGHRAMTICSIIANRVATEANTNYKGAVNDLVATVIERLLVD